LAAGCRQRTACGDGLGASLEAGMPPAGKQRAASPPAPARPRSASPAKNKKKGASDGKTKKTKKKKEPGEPEVDQDELLAAEGDTEAAWRLLDKQAQVDLETVRAGGDGAEEAGKRYERWAKAREEKVKQQAQEALKELAQEFSPR
jgi:hypothetical protein